MTDPQFTTPWQAALRAPTRLRARPAFARYRAVIASYLQLMAGSFSKLALQALYFFVLANTLTLVQMGLFASISATGLMIGAFTGFGFSSFAFRAAAGRRRLLGRYVGVFYGSLAASLPLVAAICLPIYLWLFAGALSFWAFAAIIAVETMLWRLVEVIQQLNNGLGHYHKGSMGIAFGTSFRAAGAIGFALGGGGSLEHWAWIYFAVNLSAVLSAIAIFHPRLHLRWSTRLFVKRFGDGIMYCLSYFAFSCQNQIDKLIVLTLADAHVAGIYAIATRLLTFTATPFRVYYVMFTRKLIAEGRPRQLVRRGLTAEIVIAVLATAGFGALIGFLQIWPRLLGSNIAVATPFFAMMLLVPAFKNLLEFHGELFYVSQRMTTRAMLAGALVAINTATLAWLAANHTSLTDFGLSLNLLYAGLYALSAAAVYRTMREWGRK